jgi:hypothetical protein
MSKKPSDIPQDIWDKANAINDILLPSGVEKIARIIKAERTRAVAAIHWVFSADGTKTERSLADEAINKINDPTFVAKAGA